MRTKAPEARNCASGSDDGESLIIESCALSGGAIRSIAIVVGFVRPAARHP